MNDHSSADQAGEGDTDDVIRATRRVPATAAAIFELLSSPSGHAEIDGSGTVRRPLDGQPERLELGSRFSMSMRLGLPYRITNEVVEFDAPHLIAWRHPGRHVWRYRLAPAPDDPSATMVTEECDLGPSPLRLLLKALRIPARNRRSIDATLDRLVDHFS